MLILVRFAFLWCTATIYFVLGFFVMHMRLLQHLVSEKERKTKEGLKIIGLSSLAWLAGWFLLYSGIATALVLLMCAVAYMSGVYAHTPLVAVFLLVRFAWFSPIYLVA